LTAPSQGFSFRRRIQDGEENSTGELVLSKGENATITKARTVVDALPILTAEERNALGAFGIRWFAGHSMYVGKPLFEDGLAVIQKHAPMPRKVNSKNGERIQPWFSPYHDDEYGDAKPWPKYRTAEMKKLDLGYRDAVGCPEFSRTEKARWISRDASS
jgi:hypothetical protein